MIYGYTRISRKEQSIERQIRNIKLEYPTAIILKEAYTGTNLNINDNPSKEGVRHKKQRKLQKKN